MFLSVVLYLKSMFLRTVEIGIRSTEKEEEKVNLLVRFFC